MSSFYKKIFLILSLLLVPLFGYLFWHASTPTLSTKLSPTEKASEQVKTSLSSLPALPLKEEDKHYTIEDTTKDGIQITYANQAEAATLDQAPKEEKPSLTLRFPKQYATDPIEIQIADGKSILIQDKTAKGNYTSQSLSFGSKASKSGIDEVKSPNNPISWLQSIFGSKASKSGEEEKTYLSYTDPSKRITTYYAYGHDQATGAKQLKNWQVYDHPAIVKGEQVAYSFTNAKLKKNDNGTISVYYYGDQDLQNDKASAEVDPSLMARAQRTLAKDMGDSIDRGETPANFTIPKPYYINATGDRIDLDWRLSMDGKDISIDFTPDASEYPLAFDPTLSFTAPAMSNTGDVITGGAVGNYFGTSMTSGDFNADGKTDLAVGAYGYSSSTGRVYIFYGDGQIPNTAATADVTITGEATSNYFGTSMTSGDFNADGKTDLAIGAYGYSTNTGRTYIFYNDGSIPTTAATADVTITGETGSRFSYEHGLTSGDFNADGKIDLVIGAQAYSTNTGRVYIFYNDGSIPTTAATADVTITGETTDNYFGQSLTSGDFNADGSIDLAVGAYRYSSYAGRVYIFYNDGSIPTTAATADVTITGAANNYFGATLASGDLNADGRQDLVVGAYGSSSNTGRAYIFYNDGSIPTTAATADVIITGEATTNYFGFGIAIGDFNADGRTDLVVGADGYSTSTGRAYIFYNDGSIPTTAATADVIITGETTNNSFGYAMTTGDFNSDGKIDLAIGALGYASTATGRAYVFYSQNGQVNTNQNITGNASGDYFGAAMTTGDFNADGRTDLAVGAPNYSTNTGRVYIFYGDGQIPNTAGTADVTITGEATNNYFGYSMTAGDLNADGKQDLIVGAYGYSTSTGRAYIFYNDGSIPTTAATADVAITGEATSNNFGYALTTGDLNADGKIDLAVGAWGYSTGTGRGYIFSADGTNNFGTAACTGSNPTICLAANADVAITGEVSGNHFGAFLTTGDLNNDGSIDLAVAADEYSSGTGRAYIFYNDGSIPTTAATADVIITGEATSNNFGNNMTTGDFNADGRIDVAMRAHGYSSNTGRVYIFYNSSITTRNANAADVIITGEATSNNFGSLLVAGDFNSDGKTDLVATAPGYSTNTGRTYIFYNDGVSFGTVACTTGCLASNADVILTGETTSNYYGAALTAGDFNADGRVDLVVGAYGYSTNTGRVYFYETRENFAWKLEQLSPDTGGLRTGLSGTGQELKITGNAASDQFGYAMTTGDFNADGKTDLVVGAYGYSTNTGRVYIFYNDGLLSSGASGADVIITGEAGSRFSYEHGLAVGDFNADGRIDLAVGAQSYSTSTGRVYIFYNDGSIPTTTATADVIITGETTNNYFGQSITSGDFNADGRTDFAVGAYRYSSYTGRAYIFYNDGSIPTTTATADVTITGGGTNNDFGASMTAGDLNTDGKTDLVVGAYGYANNTGRTYIFYNDGSIPTTAATADVTITGETTSNYFSWALNVADCNADGRIDLVVGADGYSTSTGRAYIFYNDGSIPTTAGTADVTITGEATGDHFGISLASGDLTGDGNTDLAVGAQNYSSDTGRAYIFYNDGSIPTTAATADVIITGETTSNNFGGALAAGDLNGDGKTDLVVGAYGYSGSRGRAYIYTLNDPVITGEATNNYFSYSMTAGDFNADGKTDLAVGAYGYSTSTGRVYIFYQDGTIPTTAATADVIITGEATGNYFGYSMTAGDLNADGKQDLIVGAYGYSTSTGRSYIFYNDGSIPTTAATADVTITGETTNNYFGASLTAGDFNADGKTDLAVGAYGYSTNTGRAYIFYNDGSIPTTAATADVIITGEAASNNFGVSLASGDLNSDGRVDLAVGANRNNSDTGRAYIFYNDGSIPTTAATADVIITGESGSSYFGNVLIAGDFNIDGRTDFAVGAYGYSTNTGRAYIFYNDGSIPATAATADVIITGETTNNYFGASLTAGDFNADGRTDLVIGAYGYSTNTGRSYIFYNDGSLPTTVATADVTLTGETTNNYLGIAMAAGDFNSDGKQDLAVGSSGYSTNTGRVYLFTSEAKVDSVPSATGRVRGVGKLRGTATLR